MCSERVCQYVIQQAKQCNIPVVVDPKGKNWHKYRGAYMVTPNVHEIGDLVGVQLANQDDIIETYGKRVLSEYELDNILITRSEKGMTLISTDTCVHIPTEAKEVYDVSGAGDTVVATVAVALATGNSNYEAVIMANKAAGVVVSKFGTAPILEDELLHVMSNEMFSKIVSWQYLQHITGELRARDKTLVFTNGCFDILHRGHVCYLREAKKQGDVLIVGLNSDASVQRLKGPERPFNKEIDRAEVLAGLESVDYVTFFEEDTPYNLIKMVQPDVLVKGGDYKVEDIIGREFARTTVVVDFIEGYSTTKVVNQITGSGQEK
jgi:D-beta-D-heptose 7-phosphate kinase/D-beta-D-heptose 1-phosphate adenosyltransferase